MNRRKFARDISYSAAILALGTSLTDCLSNAKKESPYLRFTLSQDSLQFSYFSIDSLGKNQLANNIILHDETLAGVNLKDEGLDEMHYYPGTALSIWSVKKNFKAFTLTSTNVYGFTQSFLFNIEQHLNHATVLGLQDETDGSILLPAIIHFPDMGTLRVTSSTPKARIKITAERFIEHPFVRLEFPAASADQKQITYHFEVVSIHPAVKSDITDRRFDCFKRNFISIFQFNPFLKILANNTASDACAFTLYEYATVAALTPPLAKGLNANDLIRATLDKYLTGTKGYGLLGYDYGKEWDIPETATTCPSLDSYPSLLLSACIYVESSKNFAWFKKNYKEIKGWADKILQMDIDNDGLIEFCLSGNSGSWKGDKTQRPANWWDTIGFGHKDAYSNALAYRALMMLARVSTMVKTGDAEFYLNKAQKLKSVYTRTFLNNDTGILAGWKSKDGDLHDYYFIFVNAVAISYDLIETSLANKIMDRLFVKMQEVGYSNFELGLPGNLIPVIRADYTDLLLEVGGGKREDNLDGFQIYENGGATACFTYFTINALQKLNRHEDANRILLPLLKSMSEGNFQGRGENGRTKDWKTWSGESWGYEGFLVDNYLFLLTVLDRK